MELIESDMAVLERYQRQGDPSDFTNLVNRYQAMVYATGARVAGHAMADDVAQETFLRLARLHERLHTNVAGWLYRTAVRVGIDLTRNEAARKQREAHLTVLNPAVSETCNRTADHEILKQLDLAIAELKDDDRALVVARYLQDRPVADVARELNVSRQSVERRLARILGSLRGRLARHVAPALFMPILIDLGVSSRATPPIHLAEKLYRIGISGIGTRSATLTSIHAWLMAIAGLATVVATFIWLQFPHQQAPHKPAVVPHSHSSAAVFFPFAHTFYQKGQYVLEAAPNLYVIEESQEADLELVLQALQPSSITRTRSGLDYTITQPQELSMTVPASNLHHHKGLSVSWYMRMLPGSQFTTSVALEPYSPQSNPYELAEKTPVQLKGSPGQNIILNAQLIPVGIRNQDRILECTWTINGQILAGPWWVILPFDTEQITLQIRHAPGTYHIQRILTHLTKRTEDGCE